MGILPLRHCSDSRRGHAYPLQHQPNQSERSRTCIQRKFLSGGVSPRFTRRPEGQSTIEYVLIIAIIALVVLIAGPWVSSAIRNQFNLVAGAIGSGTAGEGFREPQDIPDPNNGTAFAVYSEDDHSLMFYKRRGVPKVGEMFNCRRVTEVYTGFETEVYSATWDVWHFSINNGPTNTPWFDRHNDTLSVSTVDCGIHPTSLNFWFQLFSNLETVDIKKLDVSECRDWQHTFWNCRSLTELDLSGMNVSQLGNIESMFTCCRSLKSVSFSGWKGSPTYSGIMFESCQSLESIDFGNIDFSKTQAVHCMFKDCNSLTLDCSDWNLSANIRHDNFNAGSPGVIAPKVWTAK
ncbi:Uncharacterised protein [Collinsella aerofaciens]|nr:Uncharacterised protein [Collinsella aerofaciens]